MAKLDELVNRLHLIKNKYKIFNQHYTSYSQVNKSINYEDSKCA